MGRRNKPCRILVECIHWATDEVFDSRYVTKWGSCCTVARYRSARSARANIFDAMRCMDYLSRARYAVYIEVIETGERRQIPDAIVEEIEEENSYQSRYDSIGACLRRGEAVFV